MENPLTPTPEQISLAKWQRLLTGTATILLLIGLVAVVIRLAEAIHHSLLLFALGALVAYALDPLVEGLRHMRLFRGRGNQAPPSRGATVAMMFFVTIVAMGLGLAWLTHSLSAQVRYFEADYPAYQQRALLLATKADSLLAQHHVAFSVVDAIHHPPTGLKAALSKLGTNALPAVTRFFGNVGESVIVLLISVYLLLFAPEMREKVNAMLPERLREYAELWEADVNRVFGGFVRGQVIIALLMGALAGLACLVIGIHLWLIIGVFVAFAALIPVFGPYLGAVPAVIAALVGPTYFHSPIVAAVAILVAFIVINEIGSKILYPRLVGAALGLHEVVVLFVLFAGLEVGGIIGVLFAAPITAFATVTIVHLYRYWQELPDAPLSRDAKKAEGETVTTQEEGQ